jgi:hypothetical protein
MTTPHHDDPLGEGLSTVLRALAVLATVGEAAARFAVTGAQDRAAVAARQTHVEKAAESAQEQATRAARHGYAAQRHVDRQLMDASFSDTWMAAADLDAAANLWRTASVYAMSGDQRAAAAMRRAEDRLATLNPGLVQAYARHTNAGMTMADAMRAAAHDVWQHQTRSAAAFSHASPEDADHSSLGRSPRETETSTVGNPRDRAPMGELEAAAAAEIDRLANGLDPAELDSLQRQWRSAGHPVAADTAERLAVAVRGRRTQDETSDRASVDHVVHKPDRHALPVEHGPTPAGINRHDVTGPRREAARGSVTVADEPNLASTVDERPQHHEADVEQPSHVGAVGPDLRSGTDSESAAGEPHEASGQQRRLSRAFSPLAAADARTPTTAPTPRSTTNRKGKSR